MAAQSMSGIYEIVNLVNGKRYIGSTTGFRRRWQDHISYLSRGAHHCHILQRAWDKYGPDAFLFRIIECCDPKLLLEREQVHLDRDDPEYNVCKKAGSSIGIRHTAASRANMSAAQKRRGPPLHLIEYNRGAEARARSSAIHRGNSYCKGKPRPQHVRDRCGQRGAEHHQADWTIYTIRDVSGVELSGIQIDLRSRTGLSGPELCRVLNGKRRSAKGWHLVPA